MEKCTQCGLDTNALIWANLDYPGSLFCSVKCIEEFEEIFYNSENKLEQIELKIKIRLNDHRAKLGKAQREGNPRKIYIHQLVIDALTGLL